MADIDALTFPDFALLTRYWQQHPPTHLILAAAYKIQPPRAAGLAELLEAFSEMGGRVNEL